MKGSKRLNSLRGLSCRDPCRGPKTTTPFPEALVNEAPIQTGDDWGIGRGAARWFFICNSSNYDSIQKAAHVPTIFRHWTKLSLSLMYDFL